jgi:riboflavin synthase
MFTGIVETMGRLEARTPTQSGVRLVVACAHWDYRALRGESVSVNGVCLTAVEDVGPDGRMKFDVIPQTLRVTSIGSVGVGANVNLERAARVGALIGGHLVQGHVDGLARVLRVQTHGEWRVTLGMSAEVGVYMAPKGSVALDGISLTLARVGLPDEAGNVEIDVTLIPETLDRTNARGWREGESVNVEADAAAKTIVHFLTHWKARA